MPPKFIFKVPLLILDEFKFVKLLPEPLILPVTDKLPEISKVVVGTVVPIPNLLLLLSQCKLEGCRIWFVPFPTNNLLVEILVNPVPPKLTFKIPLVIFDEFNVLNPEPDPI